MRPYRLVPNHSRELESYGSTAEVGTGSRHPECLTRSTSASRLTSRALAGWIKSSWARRSSTERELLWAQSASSSDELGMPEAGVEAFAQVSESAASRLATGKEYPQSYPHAPGGTMRSLLRLGRAVAAEPRGDHGKLKASELPY